MMCRLFGFRSVIPSQMHRSLLAAENALGRQSERHPDGWGVAYYLDGAPHLTRSPNLAFTDAIFHRLSGVVSSETVVAHVRKATQGGQSVLNCHPFQYGRWVFAHNGDIPQFPSKREALLDEIHPVLRRFVLGDTDSEAFFFVVLTHLRERGPLNEPRTALELEGALRSAIASLERVAPSTPEARNLLTCVLTNGSAMAAHHGGKELFFSTYKRRCPDRDTCAFLAPQCEAPPTGRINHLIFSSEILHGENVWLEMQEGEVVATDERMVLERFASSPESFACFS